MSKKISSKPNLKEINSLPPLPKRDNKAILLRLWKYLSRFKVKIIIAIFISIASNLFGLLGPLLAGNAIDAMVGVGQVEFEKVFLYAGLMAGFFILSSIFTYILSRLMISVAQGVVVALRRDFFNKMTELPVSYFDNMQTGDIISRVSYDIDTVASSLSTDIVQIFASIITVVGSFILMLIISPLLVLVFVVTIPVSIFMTRYLAKRVRPLFRQRAQKLGEMNGYAEEIITGHKTIKAYNAEKNVIDLFSNRNEEAVKAYYKADYYGTMVGPTMNFINNISIALVSLLGVVFYLFGMMTIGNISSFTMYSRKFAGPINEFANILSELQSSLSAAERVFKVIDEPAEKADVLNAQNLDNVAGNVGMEKVNFSYVEGKPVLKDIDFHASKGKTVAIVGATGCGKTTLISLLMRFYDPSAGIITIDDNDVLQLTRQSVRKAYSMVLQDTWLFSGTVYENIAYAKPDAGREEIERVAKAARISEFISALPLGYDTIIDEEGMNISKGQKQLITIARAMLVGANMLILDEATSNVDTRTELDIRQAMLELMFDKTCFVIAHRLSTIVSADLILVMDAGQIVEQGKHEELLASKGFYYNLFNAQFT